MAKNNCEVIHQHTIPISWIVFPLVVGVVTIIIPTVKDAFDWMVMKAKKRKEQEELKNVVRELQKPPVPEEVLL